MAQVWGLLCLRLADSEILPFNHTLQANAMKSYVHDLEHAAKDAGVSINLQELDEVVEEFEKAAAKVLDEGSAEVNDLNDRLAFTERRFLAEEGLPGRKWFKHVLQAPGLYKGYGSDVFPGVMQAIREKNVDMATKQLDVSVKRVAAAAAYLSG